MSNKKDLHPEEEDTKLLFDIFIELKSLQRLLIQKGVFTKQEAQDALNSETALLLRPMLEKQGIPEKEIITILETAIQNRDGLADEVNNK